MGTFDAIALAVIFLLGARAGGMVITSRPQRRRPFAAVLLLLVVAALSILQIGHPGVREALQVDHDGIVHHGQVWRLVTGAFVQSGDVTGTVVNLITLAVMGVVAELVWGLLPWLVVVAGSVLLLNTVAAIALDTEAGSSGMVYALAGSVCARVLVRGPGPTARIFGLIGLVLGGVLCVHGNGHGYAVALGALVGTAFAAGSSD